MLLKSHVPVQHAVPVHSVPAGVSVSAHLAHLAAAAARRAVVYLSVCAGLRRGGHGNPLTGSVLMVSFAHLTRMQAAGMKLKCHSLLRYAWVFLFVFSCLVGWRLTITSRL